MNVENEFRKWLNNPDAHMSEKRHLTTNDDLADAMALSLGAPDTLCDRCGAYVMASASQDNYWQTLRNAVTSLTAELAESERLREIANEAYEMIQLRLARTPPEATGRFTNVESLCSWLLHRFGPDSPEGREAQVCLDSQRQPHEPLKPQGNEMLARYWLRIKAISDDIERELTGDSPTKDAAR